MKCMLNFQAWLEECKSWGLARRIPSATALEKRDGDLVQLATAPEPKSFKVSLSELKSRAFVPAQEHVPR
jgi:hypothetical protein